jgi:hypothetical protein
VINHVLISYRVIRKIVDVITRVGGLLPLVLITALGTALCSGCSSGGHGRATSSVADPATVAQINTRLLVPGSAPGYVVPPVSGRNGVRSARARPFVPPGGGVNQACTELTAPELFRPAGVLDAGEYIGVANPRRYGPLAPAWFEYIDVYPGAEATGMVERLASLIGRCRHFTWELPTEAAPKGTPLPATEVAAPLRGLGDHCLYVTVRVAERLGGFLVLDWVVIRSDRTLIWIVDQASVSRAGTGRDALTLRLAEDAWRHYSARVTRLRP